MTKSNSIKTNDHITKALNYHEQFAQSMIAMNNK